MSTILSIILAIIKNKMNTNQNHHDLRPQKAGWKSLKKMTKKELLDEIERLDEVIQITSRRLEVKRNPQEGNIPPADSATLDQS